MADEVKKSDEQWRQQLTDQQYEVCRNKGTEPAFTGQYWDCKRPGTYRCVCCGEPLFRSSTKYDSGSGWPSFWEPVEAERIHREADHSLGVERVEVTCRRCGSHLGHVFPDGPPPTGERYCINSLSLELEEEEG